MKKLITTLLFLVASHVFGELPKGDVSLISITGVGLRGIEIQEAKIHEENGKTFIDLPNLGKAELISSQQGDGFYALYHPRMVINDGTEVEIFSVKVFTIKMQGDGVVYCTLSEIRPGSNPNTTNYILKQGILR